MEERIRIVRSTQTPEEARRTQELTRRQQLRTTALVPIYVYWTSDVPANEANASVDGVVAAVQASGQRREVRVLGNSRYGQGDFSSPDWYIEEAYRRSSGVRRDMGFGPQVIASQIHRLFYEEPWQVSPHWEVFITNTDLTDYSHDGLLNFVFGSTQPTFSASVQSVRRLITGVQNDTLRYFMIKRLLTHEVGHMFGLVDRNYRVEQKLGTHCTNLCVMRQGMSVQEWAAQTIQEVNSGVIFCADCQHQLDQNRGRYRLI